MRKQRFKVAVITLLLSSLLCHVQAQSGDTPTLTMNLEECLEYALESNITLKQAKLQIDNSEVETLAAKGAFLPTISASVGQALVGYPTAPSALGDRAIYNGSYGVDLSLNLYNGGKNRSQLQKSRLAEEIASLQADELSYSLELSVAEVYVQILYAIEQIKVAKMSLEYSGYNQDRGLSFLESGSINVADYAQLVSAKVTDEYDVVVAENQLSNLYVSLKQLLEISHEVELSIRGDELSHELLMTNIPSVAEVYAAAIEVRPEIESSKLEITSAEHDETIARAGYLPTLTLTAGTGINHISSSSYDFTSQLRNNFSTSVGLNLSIPIWSNYQNRSAATIANNSVKAASLSLTQAQKDLYLIIESLHSSATSAQAIYNVSQSMLEASRKSMELTGEQYKLGMKNITELLEAQDNYNQSCQEYLTNKYQLILSRAFLNFYATNIIKL